ncbi:J domain-containing protein [Luteimonas kalidii]|uniref:J domain-containing protein n=1 Tax=Luteimonas kalidii TaxID=3042025 RepID=A0ABT6JT99_9GAMM|nr:J domain-containing protein [Luteimonas kalidii]MDH5833920.1 J domain-containing protein [Luteimonas kalidii]
MTPQTDFIALYRELGIDPACSPDAFKRAYRRRVSELHPDRSQEGAGGEEALKSLNLGYAAALEFFHVHGRFPGAPVVTVPRAPSPVPEAPPVELDGDIDARTMPGPRPPQRARRWLSVTLAALAVLVVGMQFAGSDPATADAPVRTQARFDARPTATVAVTAPQAMLEIGMPARDALDALGAPTDTAEDGRLWHYGPSWVRLACREVVDWYSSPLKPLGHAPMHPDAPATDDTPRGCTELDPAMLRRG